MIEQNRPRVFIDEITPPQELLERFTPGLTYATEAIKDIFKDMSFNESGIRSYEAVLPEFGDRMVTVSHALIDSECPLIIVAKESHDDDTTDNYFDFFAWGESDFSVQRKDAYSPQRRRREKTTYFDDEAIVEICMVVDKLRSHVEDNG